MGITRDELATGEETMVISRRRAIEEVQDHHAHVADFYEACGDAETYDAGTVLRWLGY